MTQCRKLDSLGVGVLLATVSCGSSKYILTSLSAGCSLAVCLVLDYLSINVLGVVASLTGQRCLCRRAILCPVELSFVIMAECINSCFLAVGCGCKNLAILVLQFSLSRNSSCAILRAGCRISLRSNLSRNFFVKIAARAGKLTCCCCFVIVPDDGLLVVMTQSSTFLYFSSLHISQFLTQAGCLCRIGYLCIFCTGCVLLLRSNGCLYVLFFCAANFTLCRSSSGVSTVFRLCPLELRLQGVLTLASLYNSAYGVLVTICLTRSSIGYLYAAFIGAGAFSLGDFCLCRNRLAQLNRDGIIVKQAIALVLICFANRRANQRIEGYGIGSILVLRPLRILCSIGMTGILYGFVVLCLVLLILLLLLLVVFITFEAALGRLRRLFYRLAANGTNIALASVPFTSLFAVRVLLLGEVGLIEMNVMMLAGFLLVLNALSSDAGHCLRTSQVSNPHEFIIVIDFLLVSELLHHGVVVLIVFVAIVVRIVVAFFKLVTIAIILAVNGIVLVIGRLCAVGDMILTGDIRQIGCNGNIQIAVSLQADTCNRMIVEGKVCAICVVYQSKRHAAKWIGLVALTVNGIVLLDSSNCAAGQIIAQDIIGQVEIQLALIQCGSDGNIRINVSLLCMLCIQLSQHIIGFHLLAFRIVYLNNRIILVGIRLVREVNQGRIIGIAIAGILIGNRVADQLILWVVLRGIHLILLRIVELLN